ERPQYATHDRAPDRRADASRSALRDRFDEAVLAPAAGREATERACNRAEHAAALAGSGALGIPGPGAGRGRRTRARARLGAARCAPRESFVCRDAIL